MPRIHFTPNLRRHLEAPSVETPAGTLADALRAVFRENPALESYLLDDQGRLRQHVTVFVDGKRTRDRDHLRDPVGGKSEIHVMQALSGG